MPRYDRYTPEAIALLRDTQRRAASAIPPEMTPGLVLEVFFSSESDLRRQILESHVARIAAAFESRPGNTDVDLTKVSLSAALRRDLEEAEASTTGPVTTRHILAAILPESRRDLLRLLCNADGSPFTGTLELPDPPSESKNAAPPLPPAGDATRRPPLGGILGELGRDLTATASGHPIVGRDRETNELIAVLLKFFKPNAVLLGEAGVGKTAIVEGLAQRIRRGEVPAALRGKRIVEIPMSSLVAGTGVHGSFEQRLKDLIAQAETDDDIILFIDELHLVVGASGRPGSHGDASDILKPALARGRLRVIGATTWSEFYESIQSDPALERRFHQIRVEEPTEEAVRSILESAMPALLAHHRLLAGPEIESLVISACRDELPSRRFPDKALDVIDRACASAVLAGEPRLEPVHVRGVIAALAGIAFTADSPEFNARLHSLEDRLRADVLRQDEAVDTVARVVRLCKRRLDMRAHRPDGVFLFVGKSGVGKTALALSLAESLLGSEKAVIRLDMTGFTEPHSVSTLLGSPPGYVRSDEEPAWLEQLRKTPSAILLLDELEKAHPEVTKVFLRAFDEGKITDTRGNEYSLANTTVIATSNAQVDISGGGFGFRVSEADEHRQWLDGLQAFFAPEFLNRFDEIVPFEPLSVGDLGVILREKILPQTQRKLLSDFGLRLDMTDAGIRRLAEMANSEQFGARELERVFRNEVLLPAITIADAARTGAASSTTIVVDRGADGGVSVELKRSEQ